MPAALSTAHDSTIGAFGAALGLTTSLASHVDLSAAMLVDVYFTRVHYDFSLAGQTSTLLTPHTVRPPSQPCTR